MRMRIINAIVEASTPSTGKGLTIFDIDETLFHTFAMVKVIKDGRVIKHLTNTEFNEYQLKDGEEFDFSDFRSAKLFSDTSKPIKEIIDRMVEIVKKADRKGSTVIIITARPDLDDKHVFLETLRKHGIPVDKIYVHRAGNIRNIPLVSDRKNYIIMKYINTGLYRRVRLFDDSIVNCKQFLSLKNSIEDSVISKIKSINHVTDDEDIISFSAYLVDCNDSVVKIKKME